MTPRTFRLLLTGALLTSSASGCFFFDCEEKRSMVDVVREQASADLSCPENDIDMGVRTDKTSVDAVGCGRSASYRCIQNACGASCDRTR